MRFYFCLELTFHSWSDFWAPLHSSGDLTVGKMEEHTSNMKEYLHKYMLLGNRMVDRKVLFLSASSPLHSSGDSTVGKMKEHTNNMKENTYIYTSYLEIEWLTKRTLTCNTKFSFRLFFFSGRAEEWMCQIGFYSTNYFWLSPWTPFGVIK